VLADASLGGRLNSDLSCMISGDMPEFSRAQCGGEINSAECKLASTCHPAPLLGWVFTAVPGRGWHESLGDRILLISASMLETCSNNSFLMRSRSHRVDSTLCFISVFWARREETGIDKEVRREVEMAWSGYAKFVVGRG
jgi:hypothetical protein